MAATRPDRRVRCAIYTRKSTEHGLELEFNSLDAQREACEAYIKSQASEGWQAVPDTYDDPAVSGGTMERPALKRLLMDIEAGRIDVVVVYKIDRLTRSLADFAKLVEIFDAKGISFVAITQQFNTTTSMGRLTLNVLLSFAQFERELASERVRDKIAASRRKGKWTGGSVPLGYDSKHKRLVINPTEAETVRQIFERYLALGSLHRLADELKANGIVSKRRRIAGKDAGGVRFTYGALAYLLKNRTYLGEVGHGGAWYPAEHHPIVDPNTFDRVQAQLAAHSAGRTGNRRQTGALLTGLIYDDRGNRMSPSFSVKKGIRYRFYVSSALLRGHKTEAGSIRRVSAPEIEATVLRSIREHLGNVDKSNAATVATEAPSEVAAAPGDLVDRHIDRIVVAADRLVLTFKAAGQDIEPDSVAVPWSAPRNGTLVRIEGNDQAASPKPNPALVQAIVRAHAWLQFLTDGTYDSIEALAQAVGIHPKVIRNRIRLAFLSPAMTRAMLNIGAAETTSISELANQIDLSWSAQRSTI